MLIDAWYLHRRVRLPVLVTVCSNVSPFFKSPESKSDDVTVCVAESLLTNVIVPPRFIVTVFGENAKFTSSTRASFGASTAELCSTV